MPDLTPTLAEWQVMTDDEIRQSIARGVMPPIAGGAPDDDAEDDANAEDDNDGANADDDDKGGSDDDDKSGADETQLEKSLKAARKEAREAKKEAKANKAAADELKTLKEAEQSDADKLKQQVTEAEAKAEKTTTKARDANLKLALVDGDFGLVNTKAAMTLLKAEGIEFDEDDEPVDLADAIAELVEANPFLKKADAKSDDDEDEEDDTGKDVNTGGGSKNASAPNLTATELKAAKAAGKTPKQFAAMRDAKTLDEIEAAKKL